VMANEIPEKRGGDDTTYSLVLREGTSNLQPQPVAVVGNVFVDALSVPATGLSWQTLNAVTYYP
jgi:hypothetical protein